MDIVDFKAGSYQQQYQYQSFEPFPINHEWVISSPEIISQLAEASRLLGELDAFARFIPDVDFFIQMHITKEATTSSLIEGTQTNMQDALISEQDIYPEKRDDWQEVQNYIQATNFALHRLQELPLSNRLLKETHRILMQGVRGKHKQPGEFRSSQNWIGPSLKQAVYVPPHHSSVPALMSDLEEFMHNEHLPVPHLIKIGLIHYQFETIHPFLDGNGRLGRLLIVLYLINFGLLSKPALYISDFFERHKSAYYDYLTAVRVNDNIHDWLKFFLSGVAETAQRSTRVFKEIVSLKADIEQTILPGLHSRKQDNAHKLVQTLFKQPVIKVKQVEDLLGVRYNTAAALVHDLIKLGILREITGQKRNRLYIFDPYVRLFTD
ncbi:MAG: Fic family protein [Anaerolineae bacterium]|nr:Fic family protein [Anaerolineae bacterium]